MKVLLLEATLVLALLSPIAAAQNPFFGTSNTGGASGTPAPANNTQPDILLKCRANFETIMRQLADSEQQKLAKPNADYEASLDEVLKQVAATGNLDAALQVKAEKDRVLKGAKLSDQAKAAMTPPLRAAYDKYAAVVDVLRQQQEKLENFSRKQYIDQLGQLEKELTIQMKLDDAQAVKAEKDLVTNDYNAVEKSLAAAAPAAPAPVAMDPATAFRMKSFFEKLQSNAASPHIAKNTLDKHDRGKDFKDLPTQGALLVGLVITRGDWFGAPLLKSVQPVYITADGEIQGDLHGGTGSSPVTLHAKPGYAIGAIWITDEQFLWALKVTYMKIDPLNQSLIPSDSYDSEIVGDMQKQPEKVPKKKLGGDGVPVIGIFGASGDEMNALGVVQARGGN
jgi:hypothetical protein